MSGSDDDYDDDDDYSYTSDSDDTSWKVRRASVRLVIAIVRTRPQMVRAIFAQFAELIIDMFKVGHARHTVGKARHSHTQHTTYAWVRAGARRGGEARVHWRHDCLYSRHTRGGCRWCRQPKPHQPRRRHGVRWRRWCTSPLEAPDIQRRGLGGE